MRRFVLYTALALYVFGTPATAEERFEQWSLEPQGAGTFALAFKRPIPTQNGVGPGLALICNQESNYVVGILAPSPGTFKNEQESIPLAFGIFQWISGFQKAMREGAVGRFSELSWWPQPTSLRLVNLEISGVQALP
jgi:hypothetical protein